MGAFFPLFLLFVGGAILTIGDICMKEWVVKDRGIWFVVGMLVYLVGMVFLAYSFKYKNIAVASVIFVIFNVAILSLVSWLYFKEELSGLQISGILLGLVSVVLLEIGEK